MSTHVTSSQANTYQPFVPEVDPRYVITRSVSLPCAIERAWRAVSEPDEIVRWFPDRSAELTLEPGATGIFAWERHQHFPIRVEIVEPPTRIAWTWGHESDETPTTLVEFVLTEDEGKTTVTVTESGILAPNHFEENSQGWDSELAELVAYVSG